MGGASFKDDHDGFLRVLCRPERPRETSFGGPRTTVGKGEFFLPWDTLDGVLLIPLQKRSFSEGDTLRDDVGVRSSFVKLRNYRRLYYGTAQNTSLAI